MIFYQSEGAVNKFIFLRIFEKDDDDSVYNYGKFLVDETKRWFLQRAAQFPVNYFEMIFR